MIEVDNDQAIELIKKHYSEYITDEIQQMINKYDTQTNSLLGCIIGCIICAVIYGYTKWFLFIVGVGILLIFGLFFSYKRKVLIKDIVKSINLQLKG